MLFQTAEVTLEKSDESISKAAYPEFPEQILREPLQIAS